MPLELITVDTGYFTNLKNVEPIRSIYLDSQFSVFDTYLNTNLIPYINTLIDGRVPGTEEVASIGKFLRYSPQYDNDGNLITNLRWDIVRSDDFDDYTISYAKLANLPAGSIVSAGQDQNLIPVVPTEDDQVLVSRGNDSSNWRKLRDDDIPDRVITGAMIENASIPADAFLEGIIKTELTPDSITNIKIVDRNVTGPKIANGVIDEVIMGPVLANNFLSIIGPNFIPLNAIDLSLVPNNRLDGLQLFRNYNIANARIFADLPWETRVFRALNDSGLVAPKSITGDKIDDGVIPANLLQFYIAPEAADPGIAILIDVGAIEPEHLDNELKTYLHL